MRIFVWVSYGNVSVYIADTELCLGKIYQRICNVLDNMNSEEIVEKVNRLIEANPKKLKPEDLYVAGIERLIREFGINTHESFEYGTGFEELKDPLNDD